MGSFSSDVYTDNVKNTIFFLFVQELGNWDISRYNDSSWTAMSALSSGRKQPSVAYRKVCAVLVFNIYLW